MNVYSYIACFLAQCCDRYSLPMKACGKRGQGPGFGKEDLADVTHDLFLKIYRLLDRSSTRLRRPILPANSTNIKDTTQ